MKLIEPMIFDLAPAKNPEGLIEPMEFFDRPLHAEDTQQITPEPIALVEPSKKVQPLGFLWGQQDGVNPVEAAPPVDQGAELLQWRAFHTGTAKQQEVPVVCAQEHAAPVPVATADREKAPAPIETAHRFIARIPTIVAGESLYAYRELCYRKLSAPDALRMITEVCRNEVQAAGEPSYTQRVYAALLQEPQIVRGEVQSDPRYIPFLNGLLDWRSGVLYPHDPGIITTYVLNAHYLPNGGRTPHFDQLLHTIAGGDQNLIVRIWQMLGVILSPDMAAKAFFVLQGPSDTGKSLFAQFISEFFSDDMISRMNLHDLKQNFAPANLEGRRLCISSDAQSGALDPVATSLIKQATGGDAISADVKFKDRIQFRCAAKFVLVTNHAVRTKDPDEAFFRRAVAIPFRYAVDRTAQLPQDLLLSQLRGEMDAIASRASAEYCRLANHRFIFAGDFPLNDPSVVQNPNYAKEDNLADLIRRFIQVCLEPCEGTWIATSECYDAFQQFAGAGILTPHHFSLLFYPEAERLLGAKRVRKTPQGAPNAIWCVSGVCFSKEGAAPNV